MDLKYGAGIVPGAVHTVAERNRQMSRMKRRLRRFFFTAPGHSIVANEGSGEQDPYQDPDSPESRALKERAEKWIEEEIEPRLDALEKAAEGTAPDNGFPDGATVHRRRPKKAKGGKALDFTPTSTLGTGPGRLPGESEGEAAKRRARERRSPLGFTPRSTLGTAPDGRDKRKGGGLGFTPSSTLGTGPGERSD